MEMGEVNTAGLFHSFSFSTPSLAFAACDNMTDGLEAQHMNLVVVFKTNINSILNLLWLSLVKNHIVVRSV